MNFSQAEDTRSTPSPVNIGLGVGDIENDELITSLHSSRLSNMMSMSKNALPHEKYRSRVANIEDGVTAIKNRISAVAWIKEVVKSANMSTDARDSSIQIFDKFLSFSWVENENILLDINYICFAAVSSVLISSKLHEGSHLLTMGNFPLFPTADLVEFERMLLGKIGYAITPLSTPSSFVRHLLGLCPEYEAKHVELIAQVDVYISEFSENLEYILFAPSTVAISALLIAFSAMKMECGLFIRRIPAVMLPSTKNVQAGDLLEIDKCLSSFQRTSSVSEGLRNQGKRILKVSGSPTSVDVYANNELELDHEHENYAYSPSDQHPSCPVFIDLDAVDKYDHLQDMIKPHASKANTATCNLGL